MNDGNTQPDSDTKADRLYDRAAFALLALLLILRLVAAHELGLAWDESYYWQWSRHLALCYYDAGPGVALVIRAGTALFGNTAFGLRFMPIVMSVAAYGLIYATTRRWYDRRVALWTIFIASIAPLLAIGSVLATYDLPQIFFWAAALYAVTRAVLEEGSAKTPSAGWWYVVGLCVGLGTLTKPTMIFFAPGVLLLLALVPAYRKHLASPHPYLAFVVAIACLAPIFVWNAHHGNVNWIHTINRGNRDTGASPGRWLVDFWAGQAVVAGPLLMIMELTVLGQMIARCVRALKPGAGSTDSSELNVRADAFVIAFSVPLLAICTLIAIRSKVEVNWPAAAHLTGLLAIATVNVSPARSLGAKIWRGTALGLSVLLTLILFFPTPLVLHPFGPFHGDDGTFDKLNELYGWDQIAAATVRERDRLADDDPRTPVEIVGTGYRVCSILSFYLPGQPQVDKIQIPDTRLDQYNIWTNESRLAGTNAVVAIDGSRPEQVAYLKTRFASVSDPVIVNVGRPGFTGPVKVFYLYRCQKFSPPPHRQVE